MPLSIAKLHLLWEGRATSYLLLLVLALSLSREGLVAGEVRHSMVAVCSLERMELKFEMDGCQPATVHVKYCTGACRGFTVVSDMYPKRPYFYQECTCCTASRYKVGKRKLTFLCHDQGTNTDRNVTQMTYLPKITECGCTTCGSNNGAV